MAVPKAVKAPTTAIATKAAATAYSDNSRPVSSRKNLLIILLLLLSLVKGLSADPRRRLFGQTTKGSRELAQFIGKEGPRLSVVPCGFCPNGKLCSCGDQNHLAHSQQHHIQTGPPARNRNQPQPPFVR